MFHAFWHVVMHAPVELSICVGIFKDELVEPLNTSNTSLVFLNCSVDLANESVEISSVLLFDGCV